MKNLYGRLTDWLYASSLAMLIDKFLVAKTGVTHQELLDFEDPLYNVRDELVSCGVCTVVRTFAVTTVFYILLWWLL